MIPTNKFIIDPTEFKANDVTRAKQWAREKMKKYEGKLNYEWNDRAIIASGEIEPEEIDIKTIYPFPNLRWIIYRNELNFTIMLLSGKKLLLSSTFAKI